MSLAPTTLDPMKTLWLPQGLNCEYFGDKPEGKSFFARVCINQGKINDNDRIHWIVRSLADSSDKLGPLNPQCDSLASVSCDQNKKLSAKWHDPLQPLNSSSQKEDFDSVEPLTAIENFDLICRACDVLHAVMKQFSIPEPTAVNRNLEPVQEFKIKWSEYGHDDWKLTGVSNYSHVVEFFNFASSSTRPSEYEYPLKEELLREINVCRILGPRAAPYDLETARSGQENEILTFEALIARTAVRNARQWQKKLQINPSSPTKGFPHPNWAGFATGNIPKTFIQRTFQLPRAPFKTLCQENPFANTIPLVPNLENDLGNLDSDLKVMKIQPIPDVEKGWFKKLNNFFYRNETGKQGGHKSNSCHVKFWIAYAVCKHVPDKNPMRLAYLSIMRAFDEAICKEPPLDAGIHNYFEVVVQRQATAHASNQAANYTNHRWDAKCLEQLLRRMPPERVKGPIVPIVRSDKQIRDPEVFAQRMRGVLSEKEIYAYLADKCDLETAFDICGFSLSYDDIPELLQSADKKLEIYVSQREIEFKGGQTHAT